MTAAGLPTTRLPDNDGALALAVDLIVVEDFHAGLSRAGRETFAAARKDAGEGAVCDAVDVLFGLESLTDGLFVEMFRQGAEDEHAVDALVVVEGFDVLHQLFLSDIGGKNDVLHFNADRRTALHGALLVGDVVLSLADAKDREGGGDALLLESGDFSRESFVHGGNDGRTLKQFCHNPYSYLRRLMTES